MCVIKIDILFSEGQNTEYSAGADHDIWWWDGNNDTKASPGGGRFQRTRVQRSPEKFKGEQRYSCFNSTKISLWNSQGAYLIIIIVIVPVYLNDIHVICTSGSQNVQFSLPHSRKHGGTPKLSYLIICIAWIDLYLI